MQQLEFSDGASNKFWQISRNDSEVTLQWGKKGTTGQKQVKTFLTETEAEHYVNAQLQAKLKKGYQRVNDGASVPLEKGPALAESLPKKQKKTQSPAPNSGSPDVIGQNTPPEPVSQQSPSTVAWSAGIRAKELQVQYCKFSYPKNEITPLPPPTDTALAWKKLGPEMQKALHNAFWCGDSTWQSLGQAAALSAQSLQSPFLSQQIAAVFLAFSRRREAVDYLWSELGPEATLEAWLLSRTISFAQRYNPEAKGYVNEVSPLAIPTPLQFWDLSTPKLWALRQKITELPESAAQALIEKLEVQRPQLPLGQKLGLDWLFWNQGSWLDADLADWFALDAEADPELWHSGWLLWPCLHQPESLDAMAERFLAAPKQPSDRWEMLADVLEPTLFWLLERAGSAAAKSLYAWIIAGKRASIRKKAVAALSLIESEQALQYCVELLKHKDAGKMAFAKLSAQPLAGAHALLRGLHKRKSYPEAEELLTGLLRGMPESDLQAIQAVWGSIADPYIPPKQAGPMAEHLPAYFEILLSPVPPPLSLPSLKEVALPAGPAQMDFSRPVITSTHAIRPYIYDPPPEHAGGDAEMLKRFAGFDRLMKHHLDWVSDAAALKLWNETPPERWNPHDRDDWALKNLALRFGLAGLPGFLRLLEKSPDPTYQILCYFDSPQVVPALLKGLSLPSQRVHCQTWFLRHPHTALRGLIPLICNPQWQLQLEALRALQLLLKGHGAVPPVLSRQDIEAQLQAWDRDVQTAIHDLLALAPHRYLPRKWPALPPFFKVENLPPIQLKTGEVLPPEALRALGLTLLLDSPGLPYAGVEQVSQLCSEASLEVFALALFELWLGDGGALKHEWAFWGLAHWGGEAGVRLLVPRLEKWPGERSVQRALLGLEILAAMPSVETAWSELHRLSLKTRYPSIQERAALWIARLGEDFPGGMERLRERLVPKLGLDQASGRDFQLSALGNVRGQICTGGIFQWQDAQGHPISRWPSHLPASEVKALKAWQKAVETQLKVQKCELERAMYQGRRWRLPEFEQLRAHPLLRPLLTELVWGVYPSEAPAAQLQRALCLSEKGAWQTLQGQSDRVSPKDYLGVVHPLEIAGELSAWQALWQTSGRIQPFEQLQRKVYAFENADKAGILAPGKVASGKVLGLISQSDWKVPKHGEGELCKDLGRGFQAEIYVEYQIWALKEYPEVDLFKVNLIPTGSCACSVGEPDLRKVDPIAYSELKRDLAQLR